ncbi:MAG: FtsX-like permease family protein [Streptosporangiaceae bacterium]
MSTTLEGLLDLDADAGRGIVARRAVIRWGWRLFRREWRQQLLVFGLLTAAVAAAIWGASTVTNVQLANPDDATFGTAAAQVTLPGTDPSLAADIAAVAGRWGPADVTENQDIADGTTQPVQLRAESPHGHYTSPLLGLVSGSYPAGPGQVALTRQAAARYGAHTGGSWHAAGRTWRVTGIVQDPSNLADEFALVAPGQVSHPSQVIMLLGSPAVRQVTSNGNVALPGIPAAATVAVPNLHSGGISPATGVLVVEVLGLVFIGLVAVAGFSVMAQRRLRALGMLSAIGATERNLRLVVVTGGLAVGVAAALAGTVLGLAAWLAYVPVLQQASGHVVDAANLPWWAFAVGVAIAIATSVLAARRPAKAMARVPVVAALAGRPAPPKPVHRSAVPGVIVFAAGLACLASAGGLAGPPGRTPLLPAGLVAVIAGIVLLAPLAVGVLAAGAGPRLPVAIRIALRDLVRYRARSGAALAATTFAVFLAMGICLAASTKFDNPLDWIGPNLSGSQLIFSAQQSPAPGMMTQLSNAQAARLGGQVDNLAASWQARSAVPLESAGTLYQVGTPEGSAGNFTGTVYVATPRLLATYGIKASQIAPGTDFLTMRPGLAGLPHLEMIWGTAQGCSGLCLGHRNGPGGRGSPPCTLSHDCLAHPVMQTVSNLPGGTSAPNTVITEDAVSQYHLPTQLLAWLIQAPGGLTGTQIDAAKRLALGYGVTIETKSDTPGLAEFADGGTALGIVIALGVLAASVGLIRSETAPDLRTLTAAGASPRTRRIITAATAAALGLLGAILGLAGAVVAGLAWAHSSLSAMFGGLPLRDVLILLAGLPLVAAAGGWLLAGREPEAIARQPLD